MTLRGQNTIVYVIWATLVLAALAALFTARWSIAFVAVMTLGFSMLPAIFVQRFQIKLPVSFLAGIVVFVFATIFLGEAFDFYERYWWWDVLLHGGSAIGFGLTGFIFVFMLFEGDRYAAPPLAIAFMAYCFAITIGASWEIFEFAMDQFFGLNMQKSGLVDTMWDLIVDAVGASIGAAAGFFYLKGREFGGLVGLIDEFVRLNGRLFRKIKSKSPGRNRD
jgi:hypothetical protein